MPIILSITTGTETNTGPKLHQVWRRLQKLHFPEEYCLDTLIFEVQSIV